MTRRILIAHSNGALSRQLGQELTRNGFDVCIVSTGLDCLARLREWHPDALIVSPKLTWGTGISVLILLHKEADLVPIPTIVVSDHTEQLSAHVRPEWIHRMFRDPITPQSVCSAVCNMLNNTEPKNVGITTDSQSSLPSVQEHLSQNRSQGDPRCVVTRSLAHGYSLSAQLCATQNRVRRFAVVTHGMR